MLNFFSLVPLILNPNRIGKIYIHTENKDEPVEKKTALNSTLCYSYSGHGIPHIFWMPFAQWAF